MYIYIYTYTHTYIYVYNVCIYIYIYIHTYIYIYVVYQLLKSWATNERINQPRRSELPTPSRAPDNRFRKM